MVPPVCAECLRKHEDARPLSPGTCCNARASEGRGRCRQGRRHPSRQPPCWRCSGPRELLAARWKPVFLSVQPRPSPHWPMAARKTLLACCQEQRFAEWSLHWLLPPSACGRAPRALGPRGAAPRDPSAHLAPPAPCSRPSAFTGRPGAEAASPLNKHPLRKGK